MPWFSFPTLHHWSTKISPKVSATSIGGSAVWGEKNAEVLLSVHSCPANSLINPLQLGTLAFLGDTDWQVVWHSFSRSLNASLVMKVNSTGKELDLSLEGIGKASLLDQTANSTDRNQHFIPPGGMKNNIYRDLSDGFNSCSVFVKRWFTALLQQSFRQLWIINKATQHSC